MLKLLKNLLAEFKDHFAHLHPNNALQRNYAFPAIDNKIKVAIGMRRVGKTFFLFQTINELIKTGLPWERVLYLNFEDDRLLPCTQETFRELLEAFYQLYPENHDNTCYLFIDEIQNVNDWALVIRRFFDTKKVQIYLSGSSSKLLSKEIATSLRGRSFVTEIWPYSFKEYLSAHDITFKEKLLGQKNRDVLRQHLKNFLKEGGFPETINTPDTEKRQLLQDYVELVIMRVVERYQAKNVGLLKYLIKNLLKNIACGFSVNKFANDVKNQGFSGAKNTIHDYIHYIEDAYLAFFVPLFDESIRKIQSNPKKIYTVDSGLARALTFSLNDNYGHSFENLIYLDLRRKGHKIHYYLTRERYEIDFLSEDPLGNLHLKQVVWDDTDKKTLQREMRALHAAEKELGIKGELITPDRYIEQCWEVG